MPSLYPRRSGYQRNERDFIGPLVPGAMRGKVAPSAVDAIYDDTYQPDTEMSLVGMYSVYHKKELLAANVSYGRAQAIKSAYNNLFGDIVDIIETSTVDGHGVELFAGNAVKFSHDVSHNDTSDTMFDVYVDHQLAASGLSFDQAERFVRESVNLSDCFAAIVEFLVSPEFTFDEAMKVVSRLTLAKLAGITMVQRHPAENNAPAPEPERGWELKAHNKAIRKFIRKSHVTETTIQSYIYTKDGYTVIDVRSMRYIKNVLTPTIKFAGSKQNCIDYINQRLAERGNHLYDYRVVKNSIRHEYLAEVKRYGYRIKHNGQTICIGTESDIRSYFSVRKFKDFGNITKEKLFNA